MKQIGLLAAVVVCSTLVLPPLAPAQTTPAIPPSITTPDKVESRLGTLDFKDGAPSPATMAKVYDNLDFTHAFEAFVNTMQGVNMAAARKGFLAVGLKDNEIGVFSELMDAKSLFLTANADTIYFVGFIDLTKGPMVLETPPKRSAYSTTFGGAGSRISACPVQIAAWVANTFSCPLATTVRCPKAATTSLAPAPLAL